MATLVGPCIVVQFADARQGARLSYKNLTTELAMADEQSWYAEGLRFQCQGCGDCCRGPGGYVWITMDEAWEIAKALGMDFNKFAKTMIRKTLSGLALTDGKNGDCPLLLEEGGCKIYNHRPMQCRTWPWWEENLMSERRWNDVATRCPGMNQGETHSAFYIDCEKAKDF